MEKLKLDNFKIAELSNPNQIRGGNDDGGGVTETRICIEKSSKWIKRPGGGSTTLSGSSQNGY